MRKVSQSTQAPLLKEDFSEVVNSALRSNGEIERSACEIDADYAFYLRLFKLHGGQGRLTMERHLGRIIPAFGTAD